MCRFSMLILCLSILGGCDNKIENVNNEDQSSLTDTNQNNSDSDENETEEEGFYPFEPDLMFFYATVVVDNETDIGCFDDGDSTLYCGVLRFMIVDYEEWEGVDDANACHVIHRIDPAYVTDSGPVADDDWHGWTFDGTQSFVAKSAMCDYIDPNSEAGVLMNALTTSPFSLGIGPAGEEVDSYEEYIVDNQGQDVWDSGFAPYILGMSVNVGDLTIRPNFFYAVERDEDGIPTVVDNKYQVIDVTTSTALQNAWYRSRTWYGYTTDKFIFE